MGQRVGYKMNKKGLYPEKEMMKREDEMSINNHKVRKSQRGR